jgi:hypothetical protein
MNGSDVNHGLTACGRAFIVLTETTIALKPRKGPFDNPTAWEKLKAFNAWIS